MRLQNSHPRLFHPTPSRPSIETAYRRALRVPILNSLLEAVRIRHFRPHILPNIKKLFSWRQYGDDSEDFHRPHRAEPAGIGSSFVRQAYYWFDYVLGYWAVSRWRCANGITIIFDRYFYDFIVDPRRSRINLPIWVRKCFLRVTPQPDLVFVLGCDPDIIYARKQELGKEEIRRQIGEYRKLADEFPRRFVQLDAREPPEELCRRALQQLISRSCTSI